MQAAFSVVNVELKRAVECRLIKHSAEAGCKLHPKASLLAELNKKLHSETFEPVHFTALACASFYKGNKYSVYKHSAK